ncbi:EAL domain-containing protein [Halomonas sp. H5]|uniref:putative bifunctional diguanylate cyclase/phosphodiesterase n=1 Tax=Halomonas sp. H5 TaxID=3423910 RepID=UPI003D35C98E
MDKVMGLNPEMESHLLEQIIDFLDAAGGQPLPPLQEEHRTLHGLTEHLREHLDKHRSTGLETPPHRILSLIHDLFDQAPIMIDGFDKTGRCILWNQECVRVFGWSAEEVKAHPDPPRLFYPDQAHYQKLISGLNADSGSKFQEWNPTTRDGRQLTTLWANITLPSGEMICIGIDITEQRQAENQLRLAASVFESCYEGIMVMDASIRIQDINPAFTRITGFSREDAIGQDPTFLMSRQHGRDFRTAIWQHLKESDSWKGELWGCHKSGKAYPLLFSLSMVRDSAGQVLHYVGNFSDITHLKRHEEELRYLAHHDALTNAANRPYFSERLEEALKRARDTQEVLAVCHLDLDGFKAINDRFGHAAGDQLLIVVSERLRHVIRSSDLLARLGGDEFAILLTELHDTDECLGVIERMLQAINRPVTIDDALVRVSGSLGVTLFPHDDEEAEILLRHADQAMYQAKRSGKNRYHLFNPLQPPVELQSPQAIARIEQALSRGEFLLHYQPKVNLLTREVLGFEALLRWQHPKHGLLKPSRFLSTILGTRLEHLMGEWVIDGVLGQVHQWLRHGQQVPVSFNVSANHLACPEFTDRLRTLLSRYPGIPGNLLELEFQENVAIEDVDTISHTLSRCREWGLSVALDDFGTGYSSLSHLRELPIDTLKIDKSLITNMLNDPRDAPLVHGILQMTRRLGLQVIAEGAESTTHCEALLKLDCPLVQGYTIARPMPAEAVLPWLARYSSGDTHHDCSGQTSG